jgi:short-subunit dehydrogenase
LKDIRATSWRKYTGQGHVNLQFEIYNLQFAIPRFQSNKHFRFNIMLKDSVAVVTGAASGIGKALCLPLACRGSRLIAVDRDSAGLESLRAGLAAEGLICKTAAVDVCRRDELRKAIRGLSAELGPVDLLVACAGITDVTLVDNLNVERVEALIRVNLLGVVYAIDAVLDEMVRRRQGHIVGVSSLAGCRGMPFSAGYSASKAALSRYLESLRPALRRRGIAVTTVCPGFVRTPLMENAPLRPPIKMLEPEAAARYVLKAILQRRRFYSFPFGIGLGVKVLQWLPPALYDWTMRRGAAKIKDLKY